jgi:hypothetical protein
MIVRHTVIFLRGRSVGGMKACDTQRKYICQRQNTLTWYIGLVSMLIMGLSLVVPVQAQTGLVHTSEWH